MAALPVQTRENHVRLHPLFHYFFTLLLLLLLAFAVYQLVRNPGLFSFAFLLLVIGMGTAGLLARTYALKNQDRIIRLEERLRLATLAPGQTGLLALSEQQLIALRFASDGELPALAERAVREQLGTKQIKDQIKSWRPDYWRV